MNKLLKLLSLSALLLSSTLFAAPMPPKPDIQAKAFILTDFNSGFVMAENNADGRVEPASLTKMMTAYVISAELAAGRIKLNDSVRISEKAWRQEGSRMFVDVNTFVTVEE